MDLLIWHILSFTITFCTWQQNVLLSLQSVTFSSCKMLNFSQSVIVEEMCAAQQ